MCLPKIVTRAPPAGSAKFEKTISDFAWRDPQAVRNMERRAAGKEHNSKMKRMVDLLRLSPQVQHAAACAGSMPSGCQIMLLFVRRLSETRICYAAWGQEER
jgi:hypothetical protein